MDFDRTSPRKPKVFEDKSFVWKELLDNAFSGWAPADQTLERIIDRVEHQK